MANLEKKVSKRAKKLKKEIRVHKVERFAYWLIPVIGWLLIPGKTRQIHRKEGELLQLEIQGQQFAVAA